MSAIGTKRTLTLGALMATVQTAIIRCDESLKAVH